MIYNAKSSDQGVHWHDAHLGCETESARSWPTLADSVPSAHHGLITPPIDNAIPVRFGRYFGNNPIWPICKISSTSRQSNVNMARNSPAG
jgi:hypothetical protein